MVLKRSSVESVEVKLAITRLTFPASRADFRSTNDCGGDTSGDVERSRDPTMVTGERRCAAVMTNGLPCGCWCV